MDIPEGRIRADSLDIEFNTVKLTSNEPQCVRLYNMATLPQKIHLWPIVGRSLGSLITNLTSIALSIHLLPELRCPEVLHRGFVHIVVLRS